MGLQSPRINATIAGTTTATVVNADDLEVDSGTLSIDADNNRVGIGTTGPGTMLQVAGADAYLTLQNTTAENGEGEAETRIIFEDHANASLGVIEVSHSGTGDDTKGKMTLNTHNGSALTAAVTISDTQETAFSSKIKADDSLSIKEKAAANPDVAAYGQIWVKTATPNELYFTTDAGDDIQLTTGTGTAGGGGGAAADDENTILHMQVFA